MVQPVCEEHVRFRSKSGGEIAGVLAYPDSGSPRAGILLCSPHPNFAGNMENNVIIALARELSHSAVTLRFDYRGVGASSIELKNSESVYDFWNRIEETQEYVAPLEDTLGALAYLADCAGDIPLHIVGYSFGCITGLMQLRANERVLSGVGIAPPLSQYGFDFLRDVDKRCFLLSGTNDFVFSHEVWTALKASSQPSTQFETIDGHDHFFRGEEALLCRRVAEFLRLPILNEGAQV